LDQCGGSVPSIPVAVLALWLLIATRQFSIIFKTVLVGVEKWFAVGLGRQFWLLF
jgi:hypothetical protein